MQTLEKINSRSVILVMRPKSLIFAIENRHLKLSFDVVYGKQMTLYHVHDGDFEIRPLMIGVHFFGKKRKNKIKIIFFRQLVKLLTTLS